MDKYLSIAKTAAEEAGKDFAKYFGRPNHVKKKGGNPNNLVTEVDVRIEKRIRSIINKKFPDHNFLGEETGWENSGTHQYNWVIDPIDGTSNFIQGIPLCCISIALWDEYGPVAGVIYNPLTKQMFSAARGQGAFLNGKRMMVSKVTKAASGLGGLGWSLQITRAVKMYATIMPDIRKARALGSTAMQLAYVAAGIYDFYIVNDMHIWDVAAGIILIEEAGGKVTDWQGKKPTFDTRELVATNGRLQKEFLDLTKKI